jgi:acyl dehydratase
MGLWPAGDLNPIHLYPFTSQLFGFKRPIAHALCLTGIIEAQMRTKGEAQSRVYML